MDRLQAMATFVRVAETGSFAAVAQEQDTARSVITRHVSALEAHLGTKLIARSTRRLALTAAGAAYLEQCREILDLVEAAESSLGGAVPAVRGPVRIAVPMSFGLRHLMPLLTDFAVAHPELDVDLQFSDQRIDLIGSGMDLAIRITGRLEGSQVARRLSVCRFVVVAAPEYLVRHGRPRHPQELGRHHCLGYTPVLRSRWPFRVDGGILEVEVAGRLRANNGDALLEASIRGFGISYQPTFIAAPAIEAGLLEVLLPEYPPQEIHIYAVFPQRRHVPHRVRALVEYLAGRIGPEPYWDAGLHPQRASDSP